MNIRDPRQATLSWVHHVEKLRNMRHADFDEMDLCPDRYHEGVGEVDGLADLDFFYRELFPGFSILVKVLGNR